MIGNRHNGEVNKKNWDNEVVKYHLGSDWCHRGIVWDPSVEEIASKGCSLWWRGTLPLCTLSLRPPTVLPSSVSAPFCHVHKVHSCSSTIRFSTGKLIRNKQFFYYMSNLKMLETMQPITNPYTCQSNTINFQILYSPKL